MTGDKQGEASPQTGTLNLIGKSEPFQEMLERIKQVAPTNIGVLITGESGTGKEIVAQALHHLSQRKDNPLLTVNCGAIPEGILESELFGHEKGSFTGATESRKGYFESADGGTIFLDEIGEMPLGTQVKLLRVLETQEFFRVGGSKSLQVDVRVLAASNRNLQEAVKKGTFRQDLYYRLNAVQIFVPPLRQRREDIPLLVNHFAVRVCQENSIEYEGFSDEAMALLVDYPWPGNIRELRNLVERVIILEKGRRIDRRLLETHLTVRDSYDRSLPVALHKTSEEAERELIYRALLDLRMAVEDIRSLLMERDSTLPTFSVNETAAEPGEVKGNFNIKDMEKEMIISALNYYNGNRRKAAEELGIGLRTLYRKLKEYDLE